MHVKRTIAIALISLSLSACGSVKDDFAKTAAGKALMDCVGGGGSLDIQEKVFENQQKGVDVKLSKNNKTIHLRFAVDKIA